MDNKRKKDIGFDESFKILATYFFGRFSKVITDFEILKLPKKTDVLVIETEKPITGYVRIFDYFKKFNIIEFKSVYDPFRIARDLPQILVYIGGMLLNKKKASFDNTTFTLFCSGKPEKLFRVYEKYIQKVKQGVYVMNFVNYVSVYIVIANEVSYSIDETSASSLMSGDKVRNLDRELALVKEFSTGNERIVFLEKVMYEVLDGNNELINYLHFAFSLYRNEIRSIIEKEGMSMTIVEKNIREWADELGLKDKYIEEGKKEGIKEGIKEEKLIVAGKMLKKGFSIEDIIETTELSEEEILKLQDNP